MDEDGRRTIRIGHLSDSGDVKIGWLLFTYYRSNMSTKSMTNFYAGGV